MFPGAIFMLICFIFVLGDDRVMSDIGGSSISGISVSCFKTLENCVEACYMSCYFTDHCNDSTEEMVACAPGLRTAFTKHLYYFALLFNLMERSLWDSLLTFDYIAIIEWIYDHLPFEVKSYIWMVILTLLFVMSFCGCCCMICFCSPCCFCAVWWKKRHNRRNRSYNEHSTSFPSAPPLISKP